jgi:pilus assembly protein Flp/PilA
MVTGLIGGSRAKKKRGNTMHKSIDAESTITDRIGFLYVLRHFMQDRFQGGKDRGATAVEYGLMVGLIAIVIIAAVTLLGTELRTLFELVAAALGVITP